MKVILLLGLCVAFSLAKKLLYIPYEDVLEVHEDSRFSKTTATHRGIRSKSNCTVMCIKDKNCIWVAYDAEDLTCKFVHEKKTEEIQWAGLVYQPGSRLSFLHERFTRRFHANLMDITGGTCANTYDHTYQPPCFAVCYENPLCHAAESNHHPKTCDINEAPCEKDFYYCKTCSRYHTLMHTGKRATLFVPRLKSTDSCILIGVRADMELCDLMYTYKTMTSRRCQLKCKYNTRNRCKIWQSKGSVGTCTICYWSADNFDRLLVTDSSDNIFGIVQNGTACPTLTSVRIDLPPEKSTNLDTAEKCAQKCLGDTYWSDTKAPCKQWSQYGSSCVISTAPYVKAKQDTRAITGFIYRDSKMYEPCVFKGVRYNEGAKLKSATNRDNFAGCWQWCLEDIMCLRVTYLFASNKCALLTFTKYGSTFGLDPDQFSNPDYLSATRRFHDGSCTLLDAVFTGNELVPVNDFDGSEDDCRDVCTDRSKTHGDCYGYSYIVGHSACKIYGVGENQVAWSGFLSVSGQIMF